MHLVAQLEIFCALRGTNGDNLCISWHNWRRNAFSWKNWRHFYTNGTIVDFYIFTAKNEDF